MSNTKDRDSQTLLGRLRSSRTAWTTTAFSKCLTPFPTDPGRHLSGKTTTAGKDGQIDLDENGKADSLGGHTGFKEDGEPRRTMTDVHVLGTATMAIGPHLFPETTFYKVVYLSEPRKKGTATGTSIDFNALTSHLSTGTTAPDLPAVLWPPVLHPLSTSSAATKASKDPHNGSSSLSKDNAKAYPASANTPSDDLEHSDQDAEKETNDQQQQMLNFQHLFYPQLMNPAFSAMSGLNGAGLFPGIAPVPDPVSDIDENQDDQTFGSINNKEESKEEQKDSHIHADQPVQPTTVQTSSILHDTANDRSTTKTKASKPKLSKSTPLVSSQPQLRRGRSSAQSTSTASTQSVVKSESVSVLPEASPEIAVSSCPTRKLSKQDEDDVNADTDDYSDEYSDCHDKAGGNETDDKEDADVGVGLNEQTEQNADMDASNNIEDDVDARDKASFTGEPGTNGALSFMDMSQLASTSASGSFFPQFFPPTNIETADSSGSLSSQQNILAAAQAIQFQHMMALFGIGGAPGTHGQGGQGVSSLGMPNLQLQMLMQMQQQQAQSSQQQQPCNFSPSAFPFYPGINPFNSTLLQLALLQQKQQAFGPKQRRSFRKSYGSAFGTYPNSKLYNRPYRTVSATSMPKDPKSVYDVLFEFRESPGLRWVIPKNAIYQTDQTEAPYTIKVCFHLPYKHQGIVLRVLDANIDILNAIKTVPNEAKVSRRFMVKKMQGFFQSRGKEKKATIQCVKFDANHLDIGVEFAIPSSTNRMQLQHEGFLQSTVDASLLNLLESTRNVYAKETNDTYLDTEEDKVVIQEMLTDQNLAIKKRSAIAMAAAAAASAHDDDFGFSKPSTLEAHKPGLKSKRAKTTHPLPKASVKSTSRKTTRSGVKCVLTEPENASKSTPQMNPNAAKTSKSSRGSKTAQNSFTPASSRAAQSASKGYVAPGRSSRRSIMASALSRQAIESNKVVEPLSDDTASPSSGAEDELDNGIQKKQENNFNVNTAHMEIVEDDDDDDIIDGSDC
ncbi:hypothetical protein QVD99_004679 [Batrachochytrium dendrobatidis]|nr:hypothetical protein QVD99_004679 [Batrachochytrium dendrobatidis]